MKTMQHTLVVAAVCIACTAPAADNPTAASTSKPLKSLDRIYLMVHALNWLEITPDDPRRKTDTWEQWPGRCEICHQYEFGLKEKYERLMGTPDAAAGVFVLPSGMKGDPPLIELAQRTFGDRCVVCPLGYDQAANRRALGAEFGRGLDADRERTRRPAVRSLTPRSPPGSGPKPGSRI